MRLRCIFLLLLGILPLPGHTQEVAFDWVHGTDFSKFKTYSWRLSPQPVQDVTWNNRIISYVDEQLAAKGLKQAGPGQAPDLVVRYIAGVKVPAFSPEGKLLRSSLKIYLADPRQSAVIWTALANDVLGDLSDADIRRVQDAVQEMFRHYPPAM